MRLRDCKVLRWLEIYTSLFVTFWVHLLTQWLIFPRSVSSQNKFPENISSQTGNTCANILFHCDMWKASFTVANKSTNSSAGMKVPETLFAANKQCVAKLSSAIFCHACRAHCIITLHSNFWFNCCRLAVSC